MLLGAHLAGAAIENAMLGAAHACANPLTARYGTVHGIAVGVLLPHVIRFNVRDQGNPYGDLVEDAEALVSIIEEMLWSAELPNRLSQIGVPRDDLPELAALAGEEWTGKFNPGALNEPALLELYESAYE
jgi:alcohol dehydrogenase